MHNKFKPLCIDELKRLTNKAHVTITSRGSSAIRAALRYCKQLGHTQVYVQDQGRWMGYTKDCDTVKLSYKELPTQDGILDPKTLQSADEKSILLLTCSAGYAALHDMEAIAQVCSERNILLINDVSGALGEPHAHIGDIIVSSFGRWKPLDLGSGGFLASNLAVEATEAELDYEQLFKKIELLPLRLEQLYSHTNKIKSDLAKYSIFHREKKGTVVIVAYASEDEKQAILKYCAEHEYEYTECPREIRVMSNAISIEVKRKPYIGTPIPHK